MAKFEYRSGGRRVSQRQFWDNIKQKGLDLGFAYLEEKLRGAASSIVDPETGKHAMVFVRRKGKEGHVVRTSGSPAFARELERRLGVAKGTVETVAAHTFVDIPKVYLAHASEDKEAIARPLALKLMARGVEVWFDEWEIRAGDSLRRKMESGLSGCTHFVVLLTPKSLGKRWVETEIDAGFVGSVEGQSRFIGLRAGVPVGDLSPFLRSALCPEIDPEDDAAVDRLVADIHGVTAKPARGPAPRYVQSAPEGINGWSIVAVKVAEYLIRNSHQGGIGDPQARFSQVAEATGLPEEDVRLGVLDLVEAGLVERSGEIRGQAFWPRIGLFVEFDRPFLGFDTEGDALAIAARAINEGERSYYVADVLPKWFPDWPVRQLNSALAFLEDGKLIDAMLTSGQGPWRMRSMTVTDRTRRFVRNHA